MTDISTPESTQKNIFGKLLKPCCLEEPTGFFQDDFCHTVEQDSGRHTVCALMTDDFLQFSLSKDNNLITPRPEWEFPGLKTGDRWCLRANRWNEAMETNVAPSVLEATHLATLNIIPMVTLRKFAVK